MRVPKAALPGLPDERWPVFNSGAEATSGAEEETMRPRRRAHWLPLALWLLAACSAPAAAPAAGGAPPPAAAQGGGAAPPPPPGGKGGGIAPNAAHSPADAAG